MPLTIKQVADAAGVSHGTILRMVHNGRLKATRFNRTYIVTEKDAEEFLGSYEPYDTLRLPEN
jgi:excisionase family DNA binding protein